MNPAASSHHLHCLPAPLLLAAVACCLLAAVACCLLLFVALARTRRELDKATVALAQTRRERDRAVDDIVGVVAFSLRLSNEVMGWRRADAMYVTERDGGSNANHSVQLALVFKPRRRQITAMATQLAQ